MALIPTGGLSDNSVDGILAKAGNANVLIPDNDYIAVIVSSSIKDSSSGGKYLELTNVITEGPQANVELIERLNIVNSSDITVKIAYETLARISKAMGMVTIPTDSNHLHNKKYVLKTKTVKGKDWVNKEGETVEGANQSVIDSRGYKSLPAVGVNTSSATKETTTPSSNDKMPWE